MGRCFCLEEQKIYKKTKQNKKKTSKHCSFVFQRACVFNFFSSFVLFFLLLPHPMFFLNMFLFLLSFVNPKQQCPLVVHKLTSRTSVGVEDWSSSSRPFPLGPLCVCCCCCCCCLPSRRLLNNTRSICSWHSLRTSCNIGKKAEEGSPHQSYSLLHFSSKSILIQQILEAIRR